MGLLKKLQRVPPPTTSELIEDKTGAKLAEDPEKSAEIDRADSHASEYQRHVAADAVAEARVVRKLDTHLVPLVMALYLLSFLDRSNIGNAKIAGMAKDLDLVGDRYDWLLTIFYIAYIVFEFQIIMWKVVPPHIWATFIVFAWGVIATCQAATFNWAGMMAIRFLLGGFEAGFGPGIPYLLSFFYLRYELGFRCGIFLSAAPLASTFAGALAYGITSGHPALTSWRLLFLVEGLPTIFMAFVAFFFLPDTPASARFLTADEKKIATARGVRQAGHENRIGGIEWGDVGRTLLDAKAWFTALMYFSCNVSFASLPVFLPTILKEMGFTAVNAQGLSAPPYFVSFCFTILTTWIADKTQQRAFMLMFLTIMGGVGYIILAATESVGARYFAIFLVACGVFPAIANILPWVMNNQGTDTRRGTGMVMLNTVGQCGPLLGTRLYPDSDKPRYVKGHSVCAAFMFFTTVLVFGLRCLLVWENRRAERREGVEDTATADGERTKERDTGVGEENYGKGYRFVL